MLEIKKKNSTILFIKWKCYVCHFEKVNMGRLHFCDLHFCTDAKRFNFCRSGQLPLFPAVWNVVSVVKWSRIDVSVKIKANVFHVKLTFSLLSRVLVEFWHKLPITHDSKFTKTCKWELLTLDQPPLGLTASHRLTHLLSNSS